MNRFPYKPLLASMLLGCQPVAAPPQVYRQEVVVAGSPFQGVHGLVVDGKGHRLASKLPTGLDNLAIGPDDQVYVSNMTGGAGGTRGRHAGEGAGGVRPVRAGALMA